MDSLQKLYFQRAGATSQTVVLHESLQEALAAHQLPATVRNFVSEAVVMTMLTAASLNFKGAVSLQVRGNGPLTSLLVEVKEDYSYRILTHLDREAFDEATSPVTLDHLINQQNEGQASLVLVPQNMPDMNQPIQAILDLSAGPTWSKIFAAFFKASQDLEPVIKLGSQPYTAAGGVLLLKLPNRDTDQPEFDEEAWTRIQMFLNTLTPEELLTLSAQEIDERLFWEEAPMVTKNGTPRFVCSCTDEAIEHLFRSLGRDVIMESLEDGKFEIRCQCCGRRRVFDMNNIEELFKHDA